MCNTDVNADRRQKTLAEACRFLQASVFRLNSFLITPFRYVPQTD